MDDERRERGDQARDLPEGSVRALLVSLMLTRQYHLPFITLHRGTLIQGNSFLKAIWNRNNQNDPVYLPNACFWSYRAWFAGARYCKMFVFKVLHHKCNNLSFTSDFTSYPIRPFLYLWNHVLWSSLLLMDKISTFFLFISCILLWTFVIVTKSIKEHRGLSYTTYVTEPLEARNAMSR